MRRLDAATVRHYDGAVVFRVVQADRSIRRLAVLVGLSVALGPFAPVLLFYLPARVHMRREERAGGRA